METSSGCKVDSVLRSALEAPILLPHTTEYQERQESYWSNTAKLEPACIVRLRSADEVSRAVQILKSKGERFAVRSGGYMHCVSSNNIDGGVTIDLNLLNSVDFDSASVTVHVGPGALWYQVYTELEKHQRVVNGGREGHVGVAGLLLGGGLTCFTGRRGFACDDVVAYEVTLADGQVIIADSHSHDDLFRALKGGSSNFGIVTRFMLKTFKCDKVWGGLVFYSMDNITELLEALSAFTENIHNDVDINLMCFITYSATVPQFHATVVATALVQVAGVENATSYETWLRLPSTASTCKMTSLPEITSEYTVAPKGSYNTMFTVCVKNDTSITAKAVELHDELVDELGRFIPDGGFTTQCLLQPLPTIFGQRSAATGGNSMGVETQTHNGILLVAIAMVETAEQYAFAYRRVKAWVHAVWEYAGSIENGQLDWVYLNYADSSQNPLASYGAANLQYLKTVATKFDPEDTWQTLSPGGFKLSKVDFWVYISTENEV